MLDKLNKHIFLLLIASLVLILIPASFAEDLNDTQVIANSNEDVQVITDADLDNNIYSSSCSPSSCIYPFSKSNSYK